MGRGRGEEGREKGRACKTWLNLSVYGQARVHFVDEENWGHFGSR